MGHDRCADHPTDRHRGRHVSGIVHVHDRGPVPNARPDGSNDPEGGRQRCVPRGKGARDLRCLGDECLPARPVVADALVEEVDLPSPRGQRLQDGELRRLGASHRSEVAGEGEHPSIESGAEHHLSQWIRS